jgi:hypothetical protein
MHTMDYTYARLGTERHETRAPWRIPEEMPYGVLAGRVMPGVGIRKRRGAPGERYVHGYMHIACMCTPGVSAVSCGHRRHMPRGRSPAPCP